MAAPYATVDAYRVNLPDGLRSYPDVVIKASLFRAIHGHPAFGRLRQAADLPPELLALVVEPPTATSWMPLVHFNALTGALYDVAYAKLGGWPAYEVWLTEQFRLLLVTPLYRVLFSVMGPERLLSSTASRWGLFRRGTTLEVVQQGARSVDLRLASPPHAEPPCALYAISAAFRAVLRATGVEPVQVEWTARSPSATTWHVEWV